jgi:hypothetical protein
MVKNMIHKISKFLLIAFSVFGIAIIVSSHDLTWGASQTMDVLPGGSPVPLIALPEDFFYRVLQPPHVLDLYGATATFSINFISNGINYFGDTCTTWPAEAQAAFQYAADIWATYLQSSVPITINACWATNLPQGVLGHSGSRNLIRDFTGAPVASTWYPVSLANALYGDDLDPGAPDIEIAYSSMFNWYFGIDGNPGAGQYDLVTVVMHEITHGLGFAGSMSVTSGQGSWGIGPYPMVYDRFTENGSGQELINTSIFPNPSSALATQLTSNNLFFNGMNTRTANGGANPKIYAPSTWSQGSSYSHLDFSTYKDTENGLMVYALRSAMAIHVPGPVTMGILRDIGWETSSSPCITFTFTDIQNATVSPGGKIGPFTIQETNQTSFDCCYTIHPGVKKPDGMVVPFLAPVDTCAPPGTRTHSHTLDVPPFAAEGDYLLGVLLTDPFGNRIGGDAFKVTIRR